MSTSIIRADWKVSLIDEDGFTIYELDETSDRQSGLALNGIDTFGFIMYLDDPQASEINLFNRNIKMWRTITDVTDPSSPEEIYADPVDRPHFAGPISHIQKSGEANQMQVIAQNPLWRLKLRNFLERHWFVYDWSSGGPYDRHGTISGCNEDDEPWDISAALYRLIYLTQNAFLDDKGFIGIVKPPGSSPFWEKTPISHFGGNTTITERDNPTIPRGGKIWDQFDQWLNLPGAPDLQPVYVHNEGSPNLMIFDTVLPGRGQDLYDLTHFAYHTGPKNLDDYTSNLEVVPDEFANWVMEFGGNSGDDRTFANSSRAGSGTYGADHGWETVGVYMSRQESEDLMANRIQDKADADLDALNADPTSFEFTISPAADVYYAKDFSIGDVVKLSASKGGISLAASRQRVYETTISQSDNNVETYTVRALRDFKGKVATS